MRLGALGKPLLALGSAACALSCGAAWPQSSQSGDLYHEQFRPQYHFTPPQQWMNDPNGMVFYEGEYHLFYQYNPYSTKWGPMHWGHAISNDMVNWRNLPIALYPDQNGAIFSGSAVVDWYNTSGFGSNSQPALVAIFAYHNHLVENLGRNDFQTEGIAYSLDKGRTWTKYGGNPVVANPGTRDFRDPQVFWFEANQKWIMTLAVGDHISFYSSRNLKAWVHESDFGAEWGAHDGVWECPDLFKMTTDGQTGVKYVLLVSTSAGGPQGGSAIQYFIGEFDGHRFVSNGDPQKARWIDQGPDDYAGATWSDVPAKDGRRLFMGWMSNLAYAQEVPTQRWRSAMTLPRELKLINTARGFELHSMPVLELEALRIHPLATPRGPVHGKVNLTAPGNTSSGLLELNMDIKTNQAGLISISFKNSKQEKTVFRINRKEHRYEMDRSASGIADFSPSFSKLQVAPILGTDQLVSLKIYLDQSSIEIFVDDGTTVFTDLIFPASPYDTVSLQTDKEIDLNSATVYELRSIWERTNERDP